MRSLRRLFVNALVPLWIATAAGAARAQPAEAIAPSAEEIAPSAEAIDDPKLERRLGTRVDLGPPPVVAEPPAEAEVRVRPPEAREERRVPRLIVGYRRFTFNQLTPTQVPGKGPSEPFDVVSLDFYPVSSTFRFGLTTQYGWEEGTFRQGGDAFIAQSVSLGAQLPGPIFTPFLEGYAGGGLLQRTHPDLGLNTIATAYGQLGIDVGTEVFLARYFCLSFALGYLHASDWFVKDKVFASFSADTWSFKLGMGL